MLDRYTKMHIEIQEVWLDVMEFLSLVWKCLSIIVKRDQYAPVWKGIPARHPLRDWRFIIEDRPFLYQSGRLPKTFPALSDIFDTAKDMLSA